MYHLKYIKRILVSFRFESSQYQSDVRIERYIENWWSERDWRLVTRYFFFQSFLSLFYLIFRLLAKCLSNDSPNFIIIIHPSNISLNSLELFRWCMMRICSIISDISNTSMHGATSNIAVNYMHKIDCHLLRRPAEAYRCENRRGLEERNSTWFAFRLLFLVSYF